MSQDGSEDPGGHALRRSSSFRWTDSNVRAAVQRDVRFQEIAMAPRVVIQTMAIPADHSLNSFPDDGISLAAVLQRFVGTSGRLDRFIAVDDCSVPNRLDYPAFFRRLREVKLKPDHVLFHSSPLLQELSLDIMKFFLRNGKESGRYSISRQENRVFLELTDKSGSIDLVEEFPDGCMMSGLLLETAVRVFRRHHELLLSLYAGRHSLPHGTDIHRSMFDYYTLTQPEHRDRRHFHTHRYLDTCSFEQAFASLENPYYLSALRSTYRPPRPQCLLVDVVDADQRPMIAKMNQLLEFLGKEPAYAIYFDASGSILVETSRFKGARLERKRSAGVENDPNLLIPLE